MIAYISGKIIDISALQITLVLESGVGYEIGINERIFSQLAGNTTTDLYIHHHITENNQSLFGFIEKSEKQVFRELLKISGVGGKVAMQILTFGIENLIIAVRNEDNKAIESVKGVGKKMAEKIVLELKDKDFGLELLGENKTKSQGIKLETTLSENIKSTLLNMGYNPRDIDRALGQIPEDMNDASVILPYMIKALS